MDLNKLATSYLTKAEKRFGPRCSQWLFFGCEFNDSAPHLRYYPETGYITISLSEKALENEHQLYFQLTHEVCHLLYPKKDKNTLKDEVTSKLNEGIATYFSFETLQSLISTSDFKNIFKEFAEKEPKYYESMVLFSKLLQYDFYIIKKAREIEPKLNLLAIKDFTDINEKIPIELLENLLKPF